MSCPHAGALVGSLGPFLLAMRVGSPSRPGTCGQIAGVVPSKRATHRTLPYKAFSSTALRSFQSSSDTMAERRTAPAPWSGVPGPWSVGTQPGSGTPARRRVFRDFSASSKPRPVRFRRRVQSPACGKALGPTPMGPSHWLVERGGREMRFSLISVQRTSYLRRIVCRLTCGRGWAFDCQLCGKPGHSS
jgi:hypothetical protein